MSTVIRILTVAVLIGAITVGQAPVSHADEADDAVAKAVAYLKNQDINPTVTMALAAAGESVDVSYLKDFSSDNAISYAKPIMALTAAGEDPSTFPDEDFIAKMKSFADGTQLGDASQLNDDIWGILALMSSGLGANDSVVANSKSFLLANQNDDGGWAWNTGGASDTNDTSVAIMALLETGMPKSDSAIQEAIAYLQGAQNGDGGFPYDPESPFGTDSDANSDAWTIMAFTKLGEDSVEARQHLLSLQDEDGGFWWMEPPADFNNKGATADAVIALTGNWFPIATNGNGEGDSGDPEVFFRIEGSQALVCRGAVQALTAMDVVINAADECGYTYDIQDTSFGRYLAAINDEKAEGLKGWLYRVNGDLPEIGAADYSLSGGDSVLWYYGEFDAEPPQLGEVSDSVDLAVDVVEQGDGGSGGSGGGEKPEVAFSVTPSSLDFGQLVPGNSVVDQVTLENEGQKNLTIKAEIKGDSVFNFLKIESVLWNLFETLLPTGAQKNVGLQLSVPSEFNSFGQRQGTVIFWATVQN